VDRTEDKVENEGKVHHPTHNQLDHAGDGAFADPTAGIATLAQDNFEDRGDALPQPTHSIAGP